MNQQRTAATAVLRDWQNWLVLIIAAIGTSPSLVLTELHFVAGRAGVRVGHWPFLGSPDASAMPAALQPGSGPFSLVVPLVVHATFALVLAGLVVRFSERRLRIPASLAAGGLAWVLLVVLFFCDPAGVWQWIID